MAALALGVLFFAPPALHAAAPVGGYTADNVIPAAQITQATDGSGRVDSLTLEQVRRLHRSLRRVLREAVYSGGTTLSDYLDPRDRRGTFQWKLHVYGHQGEKCFRCGGPIQKSVVAQRGTHFCPRCQV